MPVWVAATISTQPVLSGGLERLQIALETAANGCFSRHSGWSAAMARTRSMAKKTWKYIGCSDHRQPSLSNTAILSASATKSRACRVGDPGDEAQDRLLGGTVVP